MFSSCLAYQIYHPKSYQCYHNYHRYHHKHYHHFRNYRNSTKQTPFVRKISYVNCIKRFDIGQGRNGSPPGFMHIQNSLFSLKYTDTHEPTAHHQLQQNIKQ